ncbi:MAG: helix-turn-helix domain-containing protein [Planctomycetes bacterium]|nr:helix-turn-helix domain-containing protein [Planctomycetota bacterium]
MAPTEEKQELLAEGLDRLCDAEEFLKLSRSRIYQLISEGKLPCVRIGRSIRIPRRALVELAASGLVIHRDEQGSKVGV